MNWFKHRKHRSWIRAWLASAVSAVCIAAYGNSSVSAQSCPFTESDVTCQVVSSLCATTQCEWGTVDDYDCTDINSNGFLVTTNDCPAGTKDTVASGVTNPGNECFDTAGNDFAGMAAQNSEYECYKEQHCGAGCDITTEIIESGTMSCAGGSTSLYKVRASYCQAPTGPKTSFASGKVSYPTCINPCP